MKVPCEIREVWLPGDHDNVPGLEVECLRCNETAEVYGTSDASMRRGFVMLREACPRKESNYYQEGEQDMGIYDWSEINDAEIFERGNYIDGGFNGVVEIVKTIVKQTQRSGVGFIVEMRVVEGNLEGYEPGKKVTWFQSLKDRKIAFPAIKEWAAATAGINPHNKRAVEDSLGDCLAELMSHAEDSPEDNAFVGQLVHLETYMKKTQKGLDFTVHVWSPHEVPAASAAS